MSSAAWRTIGGKKKYFRSLWEANYCRYLQMLKEQGRIEEWEHEPKTFWFEGIKRGCVSYKPDFCVTMSCGQVQWHEVKGYMDAKSKTKINRFIKYFPNEIIRVFDSAWFKKNSPMLSKVILGWEKGSCERKGVYIKKNICTKSKLFQNVRSRS